MVAKATVAVTPGEMLKEEFLAAYGLSQNQLARAVGVSPNRIAEIVNNRRGITADTALRLALYFTRPSLGAYVATRQELVDSAQALFDVVRKGAVKIEINQTYPLKEAAQAHRDLEARKTTGSTVLLP